MVVGESSQLVSTEDGASADELKVLCIIRDMVDPNSFSIKHTLNLPGSMSVQILINEVAKQFGYAYGSITLVYERKQGDCIDEICLESLKDSFLGDIVVPGNKRHDFNISEREGVEPKKLPPPPPPLPSVQPSDAAEGSSTEDKSNYFSQNTTFEPRASYSSSSSSSYMSDFSYASTLTKSDTGYVGLVNQAMTCYLNSLIQTLYMTPEFRNAIYKYHFDSDKGVQNIPYQLQRLFLMLQTSKKRAVETTDLTKSFGWDSSEVWQQHDVQELCRVMFDALETTWRDTDQENLINHLYQGKMKDYVKCSECGYESARFDTFLDVPLTIRPFGATTTYGSIGEALNAFVQPETLEGCNQYFCEKCDKKCDAHKGLKFVEFPYLLTLQMKRFDFDYSTMHRIKLNHRMSFPDILNLNYLIDDQEKSISTEGQTTTTITDKKPDTHLSDDDAIDEGIEVEASGSSLASGNDSSLSNEALINDKNLQESDVKGPYVYELFSIMIHSGSAAGGHYYAYIKNLSDGQWYSFNDQHVSKITYDDIRKTYGGTNTTRGYYSSAYASSANAYMLMYRQIDKDRNVVGIETDSLPMHVKEELRRLNDEEETDRKQKELDRSTCKIKLFCNHPVHKKKLEQKLEIHKDKTLAEATEIAYELFELSSLVEKDCCRIVKYDEYQDSLECSFEDEDETCMEKLLGGVKQSYSFDLLLETKRPDQKFQEYKPGGVTVKVYLADMSRDMIIEPPASVRAILVQTVGEFKTLVSQVLNLPEEGMRCVLERFHNDLKLLHNPAKTLKSEGFYKTNKVYIELNGKSEDVQLAFGKSRLFRLLDRHQNTIHIHVNLPSNYDVEEYLKNLQSRDQSPTGHDSAVGSGVNSGGSSVDNGVCNHRQGVSTPSDRTVLALDLEMKSLKLQSQLSRSDPTLYQNSRQSAESGIQVAGLISSLQKHGSQTSLECQDSRSCSPSTQSTSTSAEFSLSNFNSICDGTSESPDEMLVSPDGKSQDLTHNSCDKVNDLGTSDLGKSDLSSEGEGQWTSNSEPVEHLCTDSKHSEGLPEYSSVLSDTLTSDSTNEFAPQQTENWDEASTSFDKNSTFVNEENGLSDEESEKKYFTAEESQSDVDNTRSLTVYVDKRITLGAFKTELESFVGVPSNNFKVYRVYTNNQEFESIRLGETLSFLEDGKINIKLGRALKSGEYRVKVFQLLVNDTEPSKFLIDTIFARGMTVLESKHQIIPELKLAHNIDVPLERCRLRKKTWKNPGTIYVDKQVFEDEIPIYPNWEVFLEVMEEPETMISTAQLAVYVRRWRPSTYELEPFQEVILTQQTVEELKTHISELCGVSVEDIEIAKGRGTFPYDVSLLEIHTDLDWNPSVSSLGMWPLYICDDGCLVYYRDKTEELLELDEEKKKEIEKKENARLSKTAQRVNYSPRKERALKIYTEERPNPSVTATTTNGSPDLD